MKRQFLLTAALAGALMLGGCDEILSGDAINKIAFDPAKSAGAIIQKNLQAPDSYEFVSGETLWKGKDSDGNDAYVVLVGYNAQNGFGALLRGCSYVAYSIDENDLLSWSPMFGVNEADRSACEAMSPLELKARELATEALVQANFKAAAKSNGSTQGDVPEEPDQVNDAVTEADAVATEAEAMADAVAAEAEAMVNQTTSE